MSDQQRQQIDRNIDEQTAPQEQEQPRFKPWERVETSPEFRALPQDEQLNLRYAWWEQVAPQVYGPLLQQQETRDQLYSRVIQSEAMPLVRNEDRIITPDTLESGLDGYSQIHNNPDFSKLSYEEQQTIKSVWFNRAIAENPEIRQDMDMEELSEFYNNLMERAPSYGSDLTRRIFKAEDVTGLLVGLETDEEGRTQDLSGIWETGLRISNNFLGGAVTAMTSLATGPIRWLTGEDSNFSQFMEDIEKEQKFFNTRYSADTNLGQMLTVGAPTLFGYMGGLIGGPYQLMENALAGYSTIAQGAAGAKVAQVPGAIQRGVAASRGLSALEVSRMAGLPYQVAGGAVAGAVQGMTDAMARGEPWYSQLHFDAGAGVGLEIASRVIGNRLLLRKLLRTQAQDTQGLFMNPVGQGDTISPELRTIIESNPAMRELQAEMDVVDRNGIMQRWMNSDAGVQQQGELLGLDVRWNDDGQAVKIFNRNGDEVFEGEGAHESLINRVNDYFSEAPERWDIWARSYPDKSVLEAIQTMPDDMEITIGRLTPQSARAEIIRTLQSHDIHTRASYTGLPPRVPVTEAPVRAPDTVTNQGVPFVEDADLQYFNAIPEAKSMRFKQLDAGIYTMNDTRANFELEIEKVGDAGWQALDPVTTRSVLETDTLKEMRQGVTEIANGIRQDINRGRPIQRITEGPDNIRSIYRTNDGSRYIAEIDNRNTYRLVELDPDGGRRIAGKYDLDMNGNPVDMYRNILDDLERKGTPLVNTDHIKKNAPVAIRDKYRVPSSEPIRQRSGQPQRARFDDNPHGSMAEIDAIFHALRSDKSIGKVAEDLASLGVVFDSTDTAANRAIIKQLQANISKMIPNEPVIYANARAQQVLEQQNIPTMALESDFLDQPHLAAQTLMGTPDQLRDIFSNLRMQEIVNKAQNTKTAKAYGAILRDSSAVNAVEVRFKVPTEKGLEDATLYFPSVRSARNAIEQGQYLKGSTGKGKPVKFDSWLNDPEEIFNLKRAGRKIPKNMEAPNDAIYESYRSFLKDAEYQTTKKGQVEWRPFSFASRLADQNGYLLGRYNGRYILQDKMGDVDFKNRNFDSLGEAIRFLETQQRTNGLPGLEAGVSRAAVEEIFGDDLPLNPLDPIPYMEAKHLSRFTVRDAIRTRIAPAQYVVQHFERLQATEQMSKVVKSVLNKDFSPTQLWNNLQDTIRQQRAFLTRRQGYLDSVKKGMSRRESELVFELIESFDDGARGAADKVPSYMEADRARMRSRSQVIDHIRGKYGEAGVTKLTRKAAQYERYFDELFSMAGMNWNTFLKQYVPHIRSDVQMGKNSAFTFNMFKGRFASLPDGGKREFIELIREGDPRQFVLETDIAKLAETYTHSIGRMLYTRPMMQKGAESLRAIAQTMHKSNLKNPEWEMVIDYFAGIFQQIEGVRTGTDQALKYATNRSIEVLLDRVNQAFNSKMKAPGNIDIVGRLISLSTGAHIAARPFTVIRNLFQSMTFGSVYGHKWWWKGVDTMVNDPQAMKRLENLGISVGHNFIPVGIGVQTGDNIVGRSITGAMKPYKWSDSVNRGVAYYGMRARAEDAVRRYAAGKIDKKQFVRDSGARLFGRGNYNEIVKMINTQPTHKVMATVPDRLARLAVERTQYLYDRFAQPQWFRSGVGRLFGQYTSWPNNFFSFVKNTVMSDSMTLAERAKVFGGIMLSTAAIAQGLHEAGINSRNFQPMQMGIMSPGPYAQLGLDLLGAAGGDMQAWSSAGRAIGSFIPFIYEGESLWRAMKAFDEGEIYEGILHTMSAPIRYDMFPRREVPMDKFEEWWNSIGTEYVQFQRSADERLTRRGETLRSFEDIFK